MNSFSDFVLRYETADLTDMEIIEGFALGVRTGQVWQLQGSYGRTAAAMIRANIITPNGEVTEYAEELLNQFEEENDPYL